MKKELLYPEDLLEITDNAYEAVMVIAKRARKIGADQKLEIDQALSVKEALEESEDQEQPEDVPEPHQFDFEKPTMIAMRELRNLELDFDYKEK